MVIQTVKDAKAIVWSLSNPSKMPGYGYSIPPWECKVGGKLRAVPGSVCCGCYAFKGRYVFPGVQNAQVQRLASLDNPQWVEAMAYLINRYGAYFRWHDSGDLQSVNHLDKIVQVARLTPMVKHWLPTREYRIVAQWRKQHGGFPENLAVRLSAHMVDSPAPQVGLPTSGVVLHRTGLAGECPAALQGNSCGDCRECWNTTGNVVYVKH